MLRCINLHRRYTIDIDDPSCICGHSLELVTVSDCYDGNGIFCDFCGQFNSYGADSIYHCRRGSTTEHAEGLDVCSICIASSAAECKGKAVSPYGLIKRMFHLLVSSQFINN